MSEIINQHIGIDSCYSHPDNYNIHSEAQIAELQASLRTFQQVRSIVVQDDGQGAYLLVAGHGIHEAAGREGLDELRADVIPQDWPAVRVKAYLAADNELARGASPDEAQLAALVIDVAEVDETLARLAAGTDERLRLLVREKPTEGEWGQAFGGLPTSDRSPFQQMTFTLHDEQVEAVKRALGIAKADGNFADSANQNSNGNALALICETFVTVDNNGHG